MHFLKNKEVFWEGERELFIGADDKRLQYSGRIDWEDPKAPVMVFPCSYVKIRFRGSQIKAKICNKKAYFDTYLGVVIDGRQDKIEIKDAEQELVLAENMEMGIHELMLFKRQDSCHIFRFLGFEVEEGAEVLMPAPLPKRRIEVYGDSVSAGEVSEAVGYVGQSDPFWQQGQYSNSWYSYSWITARKLNAQIHDIAQGGIPLLDKTGWFAAPEYVGMESIYDKIEYFKELSEEKQWDFSKYIPHVVIVAIGQNDSNPDDYMATDPEGEKAHYWKQKYMKFIKRLREIYPNAQIILSTTILEHDAAWDAAIEQVCQELKDPGIHHFLYEQNGVGTKGHIRISEAEKMAEELSTYIEQLGEEIWEEGGV